MRATLYKATEMTAPATTNFSSKTVSDNYAEWSTQCSVPQILWTETLLQEWTLKDLKAEIRFSGENLRIIEIF